ncbi:MAG: hypothetical protein LBR17_09040 [Bacteroidales bacterium]|nr:hypothetical protein [Bacteroidales bacterium]
MFINPSLILRNEVAKIYIIFDFVFLGSTLLRMVLIHLPVFSVQVPVTSVQVPAASVMLPELSVMLPKPL